MQTFLPYADFDRTASVLDKGRLGKQRVETYQIMTALCTGRGWIHHPAVKMWAGYENALFDYQAAICRAWIKLGFDETCWVKTMRVLESSDIPRSDARPPWLGSEAFHRSHQSNLIRKDPDHYGPLFPGVPSDLDYLWPTRGL